MTVSLPPGWCVASFESIVENLDGERVPVKSADRAKRQGEFPYYGASGVIDQIDDFLFDGEFLLIAEDGANLLSRTTPIAFQARGRFWVNNHAHVTRPLAEAPLGYCEAYLNSIDLTQYVSGTAQPKLTQKALNRIQVPVAPLNEQHRIVAKLELVRRRADRVRDCVEAVGPLIQQLRLTTLAAAFAGRLSKQWREAHPNIEPADRLLKRLRVQRRAAWEAAEFERLKANNRTPRDESWKEKYKEPVSADSAALPSLPRGWCWANLEELAWNAGYGTSAKCDYDGEGVAVLRIPNIAGGSLDLTDLKYALDPENDAAMLLAPGDMLIVRTNGSRELIGRAAVVTEAMPQPTSFASYLIRFRLIDAAPIPEWVAAYWPSHLVRQQVDAHAASSAGQYNVSLSELNSFHVPLAPVEEQRVILGAVRQLMDRVAIAERISADVSQQCRALDRSILAKAFRGELVPQDPSDEPAATMLGRLREQTHDGDGDVKRTKRTRNKTAETSAESDNPTLRQVPADFLAQLLRKSGPTSPEVLFDASNLEIDDFYSRLKDEVDRGLVRERRDASGDERTLEATR